MNPLIIATAPFIIKLLWQVFGLALAEKLPVWQMSSAWQDVWALNPKSFVTIHGDDERIKLALNIEGVIDMEVERTRESLNMDMQWIADFADDVAERIKGLGHEQT